MENNIIKDRLEKMVIKRRLLARSVLCFEVHITEHCNLNCSGCCHFSPLAQKSFLDVNSFTADCNRIARLSGGHLQYIQLLGGEPLLHPQLIEFMRAARSCFDDSTRILLVTNGILLSNQPDLFWKSCADYNIQIAISKYPIELDIGTISTKAKTYIVKCGYYNNLIIVDFDFSSTDLTVEKQNNMWHYPLDLKGQQNIAENFKYCGFANSCITLRDGRLYTCASAAHIKFFNDYFKTGLSVTEDDSIDIYKAKNAEEILNFLAAPIPFCRYCNVRGRTKGHKWNISRKDLAEWT